MRLLATISYPARSHLTLEKINVMTPPRQPAEADKEVVRIGKVARKLKEDKHGALAQILPPLGIYAKPHNPQNRVSVLRNLRGEDIIESPYPGLNSQNVQVAKITCCPNDPGIACVVILRALKFEEY